MEKVEKKKKKKKKNYGGGINYRSYSEKQLENSIKKFEKELNITKKEFLKKFNMKNYINFEGSKEEREWFICIKLLIEMKNREKQICDGV